MENRKQEAERIRRDFPLIASNPDLAYLDNAATLQKPACVLDAERNFYETVNANPLRGLYRISVEATEAYENARALVQDFIHAAAPEEIVFTRNATESLNLVAYSWARNNLKAGDEILISIMEHHSNLLPWLEAAKAVGARLNYLECDEHGRITKEMFEEALTPATRLVAMTHISNVLGVENDVRTFAAIAHKQGALFVCDGAQSVPHIPVDVQDLDVDFLAFSGHKMGAPMGIGVLYGKRELFEGMEPFLYGGEMIEYVRRDGATWAELPHKFEAGTVNGAGAAALGAAVRYYNQVGFDTIRRREDELSAYAMEKLSAIPHITILGSEKAEEHHGIFTFLMEGVHPHDMAAILDEDNIAVRAGHHCAQPLLKYLHTLSTTRASLAFYNTEEEIDRLAGSVAEAREKMGYGA